MFGTWCVGLTYRAQQNFAANEFMTEPVGRQRKRSATAMEAHLSPWKAGGRRYTSSCAHSRTSSQYPVQIIEAVNKAVRAKQKSGKQGQALGLLAQLQVQLKWD
jgi:hypothetical protein